MNELIFGNWGVSTPDQLWVNNVDRPPNMSGIHQTTSLVQKLQLD